MTRTLLRRSALSLRQRSGSTSITSSCILQAGPASFPGNNFSKTTSHYQSFITHRMRTIRTFSTTPPPNNNNENQSSSSPSTTNEKKDEKPQDAAQTLWQQVQTPPNAITITRMASTPLLAYWIVSEQHLFAVVGCSLAAFSDYLDGYLAKRYGWSTVLGTYLDPLADKAFVNTVGISLWYSGVLPTPLVVLWATKDIILLSGTAWYLHQKHGSIDILKNSVSNEPLKVTPTLMAKINTTLQFSTLFVGILSPVIPMPPLLLDSLW